MLRAIAPGAAPSKCIPFSSFGSSVAGLSATSGIGCAAYVRPWISRTIKFDFRTLNSGLEKGSETILVDAVTGNAELRLHSGIGWFYLPAETNRDSFTASNGASVVAIQIRIGTRKSVMALAQTEEIARRLRAVAPGIDVEIVKFETTGDQ